MFPSYRVLSSQTTTIAECQWLFNCYLLFGGVKSPTQATEDSKKAIGINIIEWMLDLAFGKKHTAGMIPEPIEPPYKHAPFVYYQFAERTGTIVSMEGYADLDPERFQVSLVAHEGDYIPQYRLMARIVSYSSTPGEMCEMIRYINNNTRILDKTNDNMYIQFTDFDRIVDSLRGVFLALS